MVKTWFVVGVMVLLVSLPVVGCGIPKEDYEAVVTERDAVVAERDAAKSQIASLQSDLAEAESQISSLQSDLDEAKIDRSRIEEVLNSLNEAENRRPNVSVEETIAGIDAVMAADVEGWKNGVVHVPNRDAERQTERVLFTLIADYHRDFERVIIDPPFAVVTWRIRGTAGDRTKEMHGCSVFEINAEGKIRRYWLYLDSAQVASFYASDS